MSCFAERGRDGSTLLTFRRASCHRSAPSFRDGWSGVADGSPNRGNEHPSARLVITDYEHTKRNDKRMDSPSWLPAGTTPAE